MAAGEARDSFAAVWDDSSKKWEDEEKRFLLKSEKKEAGIKKPLFRPEHCNSMDASCLALLLCVGRRLIPMYCIKKTGPHKRHIMLHYFSLFCIHSQNPG